MNPTQTIRVRYSLRASLYPILFLLYVAISLQDPVFWIVAFATFPLLIPLTFRPFLVVENGRARFVSIISDSKFRVVELSTLRAQLPSMKWMLRRTDLIELEYYLAICLR